MSLQHSNGKCASCKRQPRQHGSRISARCCSNNKMQRCKMPWPQTCMTSYSVDERACGFEETVFGWVVGHSLCFVNGSGSRSEQLPRITSIITGKCGSLWALGHLGWGILARLFPRTLHTAHDVSLLIELRATSVASCRACAVAHRHQGCMRPGATRRRSAASAAACPTCAAPPTLLSLVCGMTCGAPRLVAAGAAKGAAGCATRYTSTLSALTSPGRTAGKTLVGNTATMAALLQRSRNRTC